MAWAAVSTTPVSASARSRSGSGTRSCDPASRFFTTAIPSASSASPRMTAAPALILLARSMRRFRLPL